MAHSLILRLSYIQDFLRKLPYKGYQCSNSCSTTSQFVWLILRFEVCWAEAIEPVVSVLAIIIKEHLAKELSTPLFLVPPFKKCKTSCKKLPMKSAVTPMSATWSQSILKMYALTHGLSSSGETLPLLRSILLFLVKQCFYERLSTFCVHSAAIFFTGNFCFTFEFC